MDISWQGELLPQVVDVYVLHFMPSPRLVEDCFHLLSVDEAARANRYRRSINRDQYVVTHGLTRQVLAGYLKKTAKDVVFMVGENGKPAVTGLEFNMAHSRSTLAIVLAKTHAVGVDIEFTDRVVNLEQIARILFPLINWMACGHCLKATSARLCSKAGRRREAYFKARGLGLNHQLRNVLVDHQKISDPTYAGGIQVQRLNSELPTLVGTVVALSEQPVWVRLSEQNVERCGNQAA